MKTNIILGLTITCSIFTNCGTPRDKHIESTLEQRDSLLLINQEKDSVIRNLSESFKEIAANLENIERKTKHIINTCQ